MTEASGPAPEQAPVPAAVRGETRVADRVVAKVAAQAAREALRARPGIGPGAAPRGGDAAPQADVDVHGRSARLRVSVQLGYPSDIGAQCGAVRRRVTSRVGELTGMEVSDVAVRVERLHSAHLDGQALRRAR